LRLQDEERRHISRDLHDVSGQNLAVLNLTLSELERIVAQDPNPEMHTLLQRCRFLAEQISHEIRTLSYVLHPPLLDEIGLASVAAWYANGFGQRTGVRVEIEAAPDVVRMSQDAEIAMFRVLQESLANVHRHSGSQSVSIRLSVEEESVRLEIEDKGKGIPAEDLTKQGAAPLGVGIQGMRERMRQLSGTLEIASRPGSGTRVIATVPLSANRFEQPEVPAGSEMADYDDSNGAAGNVARRVLIADDHEMLREGIRRVLQQNRNWIVCGEAANGKEAVDRAVALHPDLVILDLSMPVLNGLDALKQIRLKCPQTKVLIFSVNNSEHMVREVRTAGAHGYLCKSNAAQDLLETLKTLFEEESYARASSVGA
jgi:CheY-like chemotaxis protein